MVASRNPGGNGRRRRKAIPSSHGLSKLPPGAGRTLAKTLGQHALSTRIAQLRRKQNAGSITPLEARDLRLRLLEVRYNNIDPAKPGNQTTLQEIFGILRQETLLGSTGKKIPSRPVLAELYKYQELIWNNRERYMKAYGLTLDDINYLTTIKMNA